MLKYFLVLLMLAAVPGGAQSLPDAPESHRFFDRSNEALIALSAVPIAGDGLSTQAVLASGGGEANPLARPFVRTRTGGAFVAGMGFLSEIGAMYGLHRLGQHRWERILPLAVSGIETYMTIHNYHVARVF